MKAIESHQPISYYLEQGGLLAFRRHLTAHITAVQPCQNCTTITAVLQLSLGDYFLGEVECEFASIALLLDIFGQHEQTERWDAAEQE